MITFQSTASNDFALDAGKSLSLTVGVDGLMQTARQHMQARRGEMFLAADKGVPFAELVWAGTPNVAQFEAAGRATLLQVEGITAVLSFTARLDNNDLNYVALIRTIFGEAELIGTV